MPITVQDNNTALSVAEVERLWQITCEQVRSVDQDVTIRFVAVEEIQRLNREHRGQDKPTNVLTFGYGEGVHDVAVCAAVVVREAEERHMPERDYLALVLVHGFLHVAGLDHERSEEEAQTTARAEQAILQQAGFQSAAL